MATLNLPATVLGRPPRYGASLVARGLLRRVLKAAARIAPPIPPTSTRDPGDAASSPAEPEAVHDFRVALRRLRSWLRAWRPLLRDFVSAEVERELRRLSRLAGQSRDLDVQRLHLDAIIARGPRACLLGAQWLTQRVARKRRRAHEALATALARDLAPAAARLSEQLRHDRSRIELDRAPSRASTMAAALAALLVEQSTRVARRLHRARKSIAAAHSARIAVKRLRYLVESLEALSPDARLAARRLTKIQEVLGELHDLQLLAAQDPVNPATRARRGQPAPARALLWWHVQARIARTFRRAQKEIRARSVERALAPVRRVVRSLRMATAGGNS